MSKPIIGLIGPRYEEEDRPFYNFTKIVDNFAKRIIEVNGAPVGITFPDGKFVTNTLDICDGILFQGGSVIDANHLKTIHYAISKNIPLLGICVGMQAIFGYEKVLKEFGEEVPSYHELENAYHLITEDSFLEKTVGHNNVDPFKESKIEASKHLVLLDNRSKLSNIYGKEVLNVPSIHNYIVKNDTLKNVKIVGCSPDGAIEAVESTNPSKWIIGVQFHPELEAENNVLFASFVNEAKKTKTLKL